MGVADLVKIFRPVVSLYLTNDCLQLAQAARVAWFCVTGPEPVSISLSMLL
jgi:hypothetical protein